MKVLLIKFLEVK